jgi:hypothetical protein
MPVRLALSLDNNARRCGLLREFDRLIGVWNLIKKGSVECELYQENELIAVKITPDTIIINIKDPKGVNLLWPLLRNIVRPGISTADQIQERRSFLLGALVSFRAKRTGVANYIAIIQELAATLAENKKCVIIMEKKKQIAKIGHGADSLGMRFLNIRHIEVNDLSALMRLFEEAIKEG